MSKSGSEKIPVPSSVITMEQQVNPGDIIEISFILPYERRRNLPIPEPLFTGLVIEVEEAALKFLDIKTRRGYPQRLSLNPDSYPPESELYVKPTGTSVVPTMSVDQALRLDELYGELDFFYDLHGITPPRPSLTYLAQEALVHFSHDDPAGLYDNVYFIKSTT